jgi:hypothetical protein
MRQQVLTCFDEFIPAGASPVYTSAQFNSALGANDQLSIHAVLDNITLGTTPLFNLFIEHSADGRNWIQRNDQSASPTAPGDISIALTGTFHQKMYADSGYGTMPITTPWSGSGAPLLPFVRFRLVVGSGTTSAHVKVHAATRGPR